MIECGERGKRGKCHLALQTLPAGSKEPHRFCGTEKPSNSLMGPPDSTVMGERQYVIIFNICVWLGLEMYHNAVQY